MAMMTPEQMAQDSQDFGSAYDAEDVAAPAQTDDEAFGLMPESVEEEGIPESPEEATEAVEEAPAVEAEEPVAQAPAQLTPEEQRLKSWEGRLKAREAELKAAGASIGGEEEVMESPAEEAAEAPAEEVGEAVAEKVNGMSPDEALKALAADFGEDFTTMISSIIDAKVAQASSNVSKSVDEIISDIVDTKAKAHFEAIADRHPDFIDIANSAEFKAFCDANPGCSQVVESGTARQINQMLDKFVATAKKPEAPQQDDQNVDAAEGVRSTGMRLPTQPAASGDYSAAWDEYKD